MVQTLTIQSAAVSLPVATARDVLRTLIPVARKLASITKDSRDDAIVDGISAFIDSDPLWDFFASLLRPDDVSLRVHGPHSLAGNPNVQAAAKQARYETSEFVEYLPAIIALAKALIAFWQSRKD